MSLVVPYLISVSISDLIASSNSNLIIFSSSVAAVYSYTSSIYRVVYRVPNF